MQQRYYDPYAGRFLAVDPVAASPGSFNRYWYANNNTYRYIDPDGRCPAGSKDTSCIESNVQLRGNRSDVKLSEDGEKYAKSNSGRDSVASGGQTEERVKAVVRSDGKLTAKPLSNVSKAETDQGHSAKGNLPDGTEFVMHGHVNNTMADQSGLGDSQAPLDASKPNVAVTANDRVGVREIENGKLQHRMLRGSMTPSEIKQIRKDLDQAATLYNDR